MSFIKTDVTKSESKSGIDLSVLATPGANAAPVAAKPLAIPPSCLTPEAVAYMQDAIKQATQGLMEQVRDLATKSATPAAAAVSGLTAAELVAALSEAERIRRLPSETELKFQKRLLRERKAMADEIKTNSANTKLRQSACEHRYVNGQSSYAVVNNYLDKNPRFICMRCHYYCEPRHWVVGEFPTEDNPTGTDRIDAGDPTWAAVAKSTPESTRTSSIEKAAHRRTP